MRFNKAELISLASNANTKFDREGPLVITERQEGFFRRTDVNYPRWCKLRGNLLFYLKDHEPSAHVTGVLVLENCRPLIRNEEREFDGYAFILEFGGSLPQRISARTANDRLDWVKSIQLASNSYLNRQIKYLEDQIATALAAKSALNSSQAAGATSNVSAGIMGNRIELGAPYSDNASDACLLNLAPTVVDHGAGDHQLLEQQQYQMACGRLQQPQPKVEEDLVELPICESALSCDNLPRNGSSRLPNPRVVCSVLAPGENCIWREYARTELIEQSSNPQFLCTIVFRPSAGFNAETLLRFTVYDVRERVSLTAVPLGYAEVALGVIQDATRFRIPLRSLRGECGHITIASWAPDTSERHSSVPPPRSTTQVFEAAQEKVHRRSQSLPPKLGVRLFVPIQYSLQRVFANPAVHTYRLYSALGADISVHESLLESRLCLSVPQQLLSIWIQREKELLQEIAGMGELSGDWRWRQMHLLETHLKLLKDYSQAKQNVQQLIKDGANHFKRSSVKTDESLEFLPVNLHLQRMWAQNDTLNRTGVLDIITVGAFTRHNGKEQRKSGGLIKLLQESKSSKAAQSNACKVQAANDAVHATKQLRKEIVELMSQLLCLAKCKNPKGMMPLCNEMITKSKTLLNIWEPTFVEEAVAFIERHRIIEDPDETQLQPMSPFRKITKQLSDLDLKSPELEDFATPIVAPPDLWPRLCKQQSHVSAGSSGAHQLMRSNSWHPSPSPSTLDISAINTLQHTVKCYNEHLRKLELAAATTGTASAETAFQSLPVCWHNSDIATTTTESTTNGVAELQLIDLDDMPATMSHNAGFLDTKIMSSSPSANYYRPTEEPEPLDLTQLNIEASVMCLVSKIKFFCGRSDSPAIRLRHPKTNMKRAGFTSAPSTARPPDLVANNETQLPASTAVPTATTSAEQQQLSSNNGTSLNLDLTQSPHTSEQVAKKGNKFTDGLDLSLTTDWASELRPSMRKLRHAMDRLLKTARLMHSVQRLQQDMQSSTAQSEIMYRRDVCFSQALTSLVSALMCKLWGTEITPNFISILRDLGPLACFEGLLSLYGNESDMWSDMCIAIEDLSAVNFTLVRSSNIQSDSHAVPIPRLTGCRQTLEVRLPVPEHVYTLLSNKSMLTFKITPVFFNIGINEKATIAETLGQTREQHRSNWDNYLRLKQYYNRYRKLNLVKPDTPSKHEPHLPAPETLLNMLNFMDEQLRANVSKNVKILHLAEDACRLMSGLRFTSCKSAKDRTGMAVTLEQCRVLVQEFQLPAKNVPYVLNTMRSEGTRMDNVFKNINKRKYAFNLPQVLSLPAMYRPPVGAYGKAET